MLSIQILFPLIPFAHSKSKGILMAIAPFLRAFLPGIPFDSCLIGFAEYLPSTSTSTSLSTQNLVANIVVIKEYFLSERLNFS